MVFFGALGKIYAGKNLSLLFIWVNKATLKMMNDFMFNTGQKIKRKASLSQKSQHERNKGHTTYRAKQSN